MLMIYLAQEIISPTFGWLRTFTEKTVWSLTWLLNVIRVRATKAMPPHGTYVLVLVLFHSWAESQSG